MIVEIEEGRRERRKEREKRKERESARRETKGQGGEAKDTTE
jgi:hypothetical protein